VGVAVEFSGNPYLTGQTVSTNVPTTQGAFQTKLEGVNTIAFIIKIGLETGIATSKLAP
jgi:hypothetical protein